MVAEVADYGKLPPIKSGVSKPNDAFRGRQAQSDKVPVRTSHDDFSFFDFHNCLSWVVNSREDLDGSNGHGRKASIDTDKRTGDEVGCFC